MNGISGKQRKIVQGTVAFYSGLWTLKDGKYYKWFCEMIEEDFSLFDVFLD